MASNPRLWGRVSEEAAGQDTGADAVAGGVEPSVDNQHWSQWLNHLKI
jgi:hypothetical protein